MGGSIAVAGSAVKWARDQLGIFKTANEVGELASKVKGSLLRSPIAEFRYCWRGLCHGLLRSLGSVLEK